MVNGGKMDIFKPFKKARDGFVGYFNGGQEWSVVWIIKQTILGIYRGVKALGSLMAEFVQRNSKGQDKQGD